MGPLFMVVELEALIKSLVSKCKQNSVGIFPKHELYAFAATYFKS